MTKRGSLAYYLAAWICGCFFMTLCVWLAGIWHTQDGGSAPLWMHGASGFLFAYFYGLLLGFLPSLATGFILRRAMKAAGWTGVMEWAIAGAMALLVVVVVLAATSRIWERGGEQLIELVVSRGAQLIMAAGWWLAIPAGAATGLVLQRINRAFNRPPTIEAPTGNSA